MQFAKWTVFVVFCGLVLANVAVEVAWSRDESPDLDRYGLQPMLLMATIGLILVQVLIYWLAERQPPQERAQGFPVTPKDNCP